MTDNMPQGPSTEDIATLKQQQTTAAAKVTRKRNRIMLLMVNPSNFDSVNRELDEFVRLYDAYRAAHDALCMSLTSPSATDHEVELFSHHECDALQFREVCEEWLRQTPPESENPQHSNEMPDEADDAGSTVTASSRHSSLSTRASRIEERARLASLLAERRNAEKRAELQRKRLELEAQESTFLLDVEIEKSRARERVLAESDDSADDDVVCSRALHSTTLQPSATPKPAPFAPPLDSRPAVAKPETATPVAIATNNLHRAALSSTAAGATAAATATNPQIATSSLRAAESTPLEHSGEMFHSHDITDFRDPSNVYQNAVHLNSQFPPMNVSCSLPSACANVPPLIDLNDDLNVQCDNALGALYCSPPNHPAHPLIPNANTSFDPIISALSLPKPDIEPFYGDISKYRSFISSYDARIGQRPISDNDKLYYLNQFLRGEAQEFIEVCFHMPKGGYVTARKILETEFGNPHKLAMNYMNGLSDWVPIKTDDPTALRRFSHYLTKCLYAMRGVNYEHFFDHPSAMVNAVQKLPTFLQNKWREHAHALARKSVARFADFVRFVGSASDVANDPIYGKCSSMKTDVKHVSLSTNAQSLDTPLTQCALCNDRHDLDDCPAFRVKSIELKRDFLKSQRLCFACFGHGHISKGCSSRRQCGRCGKLHPTALHIDGYVNEQRGSQPKKQSGAANANHVCGVTAAQSDRTDK